MRSGQLTIIISLALLVACAPATNSTSAPVDESPTTAVVPTTDAIPTVAPTAVGGQPSAGDPSAVVYGRTDEGAYFYGAADAPVTLTDYSDFL